MIENIEHLLDVMESAALRQAAHVERTAHDPVARPLDMRRCIFAALVTAQAEGAEMVPRGVLNKMKYAFTSYGALPPVNPLRIADKE